MSGRNDDGSVIRGTTDSGMTPQTELAPHYDGDETEIGSEVDSRTDGTSAQSMGGDTVIARTESGSDAGDEAVIGDTVRARSESGSGVVAGGGESPSTQASLVAPPITVSAPVLPVVPPVTVTDPVLPVVGIPDAGPGETITAVPVERPNVRSDTTRERDKGQ